MESLASLFVGRPLRCVAVAVAFVTIFIVRRSTSADGDVSRWPLVAAVAWSAYAAWEWLILVRTPEANIRVDLLLIGPALVVLSTWAVYRALRPGSR